MKASALRDALDKLIAEHGDREVYLPMQNGEIRPIGRITYAATESFEGIEYDKGYVERAKRRVGIHVESRA